MCGKMSEQCSSLKKCGPDKLIKRHSEDKRVENFKGAKSNGIVDYMFLLSEKIWSVSTKVECMGQELSKKLHHAGSTSKKVRRVLANPWVVRSVVAFLTIFYFGVPVWFYFCPWLRREAVFMHFADWPFQNFASPESYGLTCTKNFYIETSPGVELGVWHVLPRSIDCSSKYPSLKDDDRLVILYLHGSAESRSASYRRSMYRVLTGEHVDAHLISFDYRGFGDSTFTSPTVKTLQEDAEGVYRWLRHRLPSSRIVIWGHSMGSGIAVRLGQTLASQNEYPFAVVLEAPFTSVADATHTFPLSFFHRRMPLFQQFCTERVRHPDTDLNSEERIGSLAVPILILHAADDSMVWLDQGKRLWRRALQERPGALMAPVFVELDGKYGCGHRNIHKAPEVPGLVSTFFENVRKHRNQAK